MAFLIRLLLRASDPRDFTRQSLLLKYVMLSGMATLFFL
jgi:hypothetical protein